MYWRCTETRTPLNQCQNIFSSLIPSSKTLCLSKENSSKTASVLVRNSAAGLFKQTVELNDNLVLKHKNFYTGRTDGFVSCSYLGKDIFKAFYRQYVLLGRASLLW